MDQASRNQTDFNELVTQIKTLTTELTAMHSELYWLAMQAKDVASRETPSELSFEALADLKTAVDNMRLLLWDYIEVASTLDPKAVQEGMEVQRVRRATEFLQLLRRRLGRAPEQEPMSFIERINAAVKKSLKDRAA
ncbi:MAG TPA: hypothetical protein VFL42_12060 [Terriglobales bacterium]|nr:hypothetical protein [Terriglobales bacterium]